MLISLEKLIEIYSLNITGILHIGACQLEEKYDYNRLGISDERILWFDANPHVVNLMKHTHPTAHIFAYAIGNRDDDNIKLNVSNNLQSSSILELNLHKMFYPNIVYTNTVDTRMRKISTLINSEEINIDGFNFLNLDIQGYELEALKGFDDLLNNIDYIYSEINDDYLYEGCCLTNQLDDYLAKFGFTRVSTVWTSERWGDGFYMKKKD